VKSFAHLCRSLWGADGARRLPGHARPTVEALEDRRVPSATSIIQSNFNGTAIAAGNTVWFSSVAKVSGLGSAPATLFVENATIDFSANGTAYHVSVPNAAVTFSPTVTTAATTFDAATSTWETTVPLNPAGNTFLAGVALPVPGGLPGGINPVTWQATFQSDTPGLTVNWQWAAAVYSNFATDYNALNVKPVDSNQLSAYKNSDHAGTPEAFRPYVLGGARGGGGSNFTGSYSATGHVQPSVVQPTASLSGNVVDQNGSAVAGAVIELTGTDANGQAVDLFATTDSNGNYTFSNLTPGTSYTLTEIQLPPGYTPSVATPGTVNGMSDGTGTSANQISGITLSAGNNGINFDFAVSNNITQ
jgi:hypothetical protein